jgi:hypothetical protein
MEAPGSVRCRGPAGDSIGVDANDNGMLRASVNLSRQGTCAPRARRPLTAIRKIPTKRAPDFFRKEFDMLSSICLEVAPAALLSLGVTCTAPADLIVLLIAAADVVLNDYRTVARAKRRLYELAHTRPSKSVLSPKGSYSFASAVSPGSQPMTRSVRTGRGTRALHRVAVKAMKDDEYSVGRAPKYWCDLRRCPYAP